MSINMKQRSAYYSLPTFQQFIVDNYFSDEDISSTLYCLQLYAYTYTCTCTNTNANENTNTYGNTNTTSSLSSWIIFLVHRRSRGTLKTVRVQF